MTRIFIAWMALLLAGGAYAADRTVYADPIHLSEYVTDARATIESGMDRFGWTIQSEQPGKILAQLAHDKHTLVVAILYDNRTIRFEDVSAEAVDCEQSSSYRYRSKNKPPGTVKCEVNDGNVVRWRVSLRRGILRSALEQARRDAEAQYYALPADKRKESPEAGQKKSKKRDPDDSLEEA